MMDRRSNIAESRTERGEQNSWRRNGTQAVGSWRRNQQPLSEGEKDSRISHKFHRSSFQERPSQTNSGQSFRKQQTNLERSQKGGANNGVESVQRTSLGTGAVEERRDEGPIVGACLDMCPEKERRDRERFKDLAVFERVDGNRERTSAELAVKKFSRNAAERADEIRPLPVLRRTMDYLLNLLDDSRGQSLLTVHAFLWDRFRAIRQDLTLQHCCNAAAVEMHEQMARFYISAHYELCECARARACPGEERFEAHMNLEQLSKTLAGLFQMYDDLHRKEGLGFRTEPEFRAYYILLQIKYRGTEIDASAVTHFLMRLRPSILQSPEVRFALRAFCCSRAGDYARFFKLAQSAHYLQACILHGAFPQIRWTALKIVNKSSMKGQAWPLAHISSVLLTEGEVSIGSLCLDYGLSLSEDRTGQPAVVLNQPGQNLKALENIIHTKASMVDRSRGPQTLRSVVEAH